MRGCKGVRGESAGRRGDSSGERKVRSRLVVLLPALVAASALGLNSQDAAAQDPRPEDFVDYEDVAHVAMAPDGEKVLVVTRRADPEANAVVETVWLVAVDGGDPPRALDLPKGTRDLTWHPDGRRLALVAPHDGVPQVKLGRPGDGPGGFEAVTDAPQGVRGYEFGPDGATLAFTQAVTLPAPHDSGGTGPQGRGEVTPERRGVEVDVESFSILDLMANRLPQRGEAPWRRTELWVQAGSSGTAERISGERSVTGFALSPDGERVGMTAKKGARRPHGLPAQGADLLVHERSTGETRTLRQGQDGEGGSGYEDRLSHSGPVWSPSGRRLGFRVTDHTDRMASVAGFGIHDLDRESSRIVVRAEDTELHAHALHWDREHRILVERTARADRGLWALSVEDGALEPIRASQGSHTTFSFADDVHTAAWVQESVGTPPEVHAGDPFEGAMGPVTAFNESQARLTLPEAEEVQWSSEDGTNVSGWLLEPSGAEPSDPAPLVVFLAGGPTFVVTDAYRPYPRGIWPMPLTLLAHRGYAVLVVHYRGTSSFGADFQRVAVGTEDVADIHTGIEAVGARPDIDAERLGIIGHSHGAWIGPLAAGEGPGFQAASFAEGTANFLGTYSAMPGFLNVELHEAMLGASPWEDLETYLDLSPDLQTRFVENTPTLVEAGEKAAALHAHMLGKAFWRHGTPHQVVIYPETGHNIAEPEVMVESMNRNLEWFGEWLPR